MKTFRKHLKLTESPFYGISRKKISKEELDSLPIWDQEGGIGCRESRTESVDEESTNDNSDDEVHEKFKHSREPTTDELNSIKHYTEHSHKINSDSRSGVVNEHHKHLDLWLNDSNAKDDEFLYHGLRKPPYFPTKDTSNKFKLNSYLSTSSDKNIAKRFSKTDKSENKKHVLKIYTPKNSKAVSIKNYSDEPDEKEILVHRHHVLEIHQTPSVEGNTVY